MMNRALKANAKARASAALLAVGLCALVFLHASAQPPEAAKGSGTSPAHAAPPSVPVTASTQPGCTVQDLVATGMVSGTLLDGLPRVVQDSQLASEGTVWNAGSAVQLRGPVGDKPGGELVIDLHEERELAFFVLQGDNNDYYSIEGSADGISYTPVWTAEPVMTGMGLRTRSGSLPKPVHARFLRVRGSGGDGYYSVSELRASCKQPTVWPPALIVPPKQYGWHAIDNDVMVEIKSWAAVIGTLLLIAIAIIAKVRELAPPASDLARRLKASAISLDVVLALMGVFAFFSWWNLGHFHFDHYEHTWEHYHYYVGAKYGPELRYSRLYECTAIADIEDGFRERVKKREMRDLAVTNELGPSDPIINDPVRCTSHFTPERWKAFREDIRFFRNRFSAERWDESQTDHGYNGTPVWAVVGRLIANYGDLTWTKIQVMAWIDSVFLVMMWLASLWAFGWRPTCVALLWWGFNFPARFYWNGGSFLRYDWILWLVVGICLLKKRYHFSAGLALTYATLLRVFPGFVVAALILKALARIVRMRRLVVSRGHLRFAAGCILALALLIPASGWATGGLDAWQQFSQNSKKHLSTALTNNMGLKTAVGYDADTSAKYLRNAALHDPFATWKDARSYFYKKRGPVLYALLFLFCVMLARAGDREPDWAAACLGTGLIAMGAELTCYYYGFLLTYGLLWHRHKLPGILATALGGLTCFLSMWIDWNDDHFAGMSLATSAVIVAVTATIAFGPRSSAISESETGNSPEA
jgi:hypothetical protein